MWAKSTSTVQSLCERILAAELVPFEAAKMIFQGQVLEGRQQLGSTGIALGGDVAVSVEISKALLCHQLAGLLRDRALSVSELGDLFCYRFGAPVRRALELLGLRCTLREFLDATPEHFQVKSGSVTLQGPGPAPPMSGGLNQRYLDLDARMTNCPSVQDAVEALELVIQSAQGSFLSVGRILRLGSVGRGTAIEGSTDAQVLLLLKGMPKVDRQKWMPPLLTALAAALSQDLGEKAKQISVVEDTVHVRFAGASVDVILDALGGPVALALERRARIFEKQPPFAKTTSRLVKWWRNQQLWSSDATRPSDLVLEHLVAATAPLAPEHQVAAVAAALAALASFSQEQVVDPVDPTVNLADAKSFDHQQLVQLAAKSSGHLLL
mmetsp:Transcript_16715/g.28898  ORF Transcript_16715/g.28898 Transcript_16715/m.28898 type:complete len:381 (+) Transcript_16715:411-1553(+)